MSKKQLEKEQARIDTLKAQLSKAQTGSTTGSGITVGQTTATSGAITVNTAAPKPVSSDKSHAELKDKDHGNGKAYGKYKVNGKSSKEGRSDNEDQNENDN